MERNGNQSGIAHVRQVSKETGRAGLRPTNAVSIVKQLNEFWGCFLFSHITWPLYSWKGLSEIWLIFLLAIIQMILRSNSTIWISKSIWLHILFHMNSLAKMLKFMTWSGFVFISQDLTLVYTLWSQAKLSNILN